MSWWTGTRLVISRELLVRVRTRSFLVSTAVLLVVFGGVLALPKLIGINSYSLGVVAQTQELGEKVRVAGDAGEIKIKLKTYPDAAAARAAAGAGDVTVALLDGGKEVVSKKEIPSGLSPVLLAVTAADLQEKALAAKGIDLASVTPAPPKLTSIEPQKKDAEKKRFQAFFIMVLLGGQVLTFSTAVAQGIVEEKSSRVIEVLVSTIRPTQILVGKVFGVGLASLLQLLILAGAGLSIGSAVGAVHLDSTDYGIIAQVLPWFVLSFILNSTLYAAAAATVSRQEDLQTALGPLQFLFFANVIVGQFGLTNPDRPLVEILSYVPPFSPVLMVERWAGGVAGSGSVLLAMGIMAVATVAAAIIGSRAYLDRVLYFGSKVSFLNTFSRRKKPA